MASSPAPRPSAARRPGGRTAQVRARILTATAQLIAEHGITGFGYEAVAELAGVHKSSVYRNWPDHAQLVRDALLEAAGEMASLADTGDLRRDLVDFLVALGESLNSPRGQALWQAARSARGNPATLGTVTEIFEQRSSFIEERLKNAVAQGQLPAADSYLVTQMLSGPVHAYIDQGVRPFTRTEAERITDVVLAGLRHTAS